MSDGILTHRTRSCEVTVSTATAACTSVDMRDMAAGLVHVSGVTATATISLYGSSDNVTFVPLYGHDGQPATISVASSGGSEPMPDAVYPLRFVRLVSGTDLGTNAATSVSLKS